MSGRRYVVVGLGAIGGTVAAGLHRAERAVVGVARGAHLEAIRSEGLRLNTPDGAKQVAIDVRPALGEVGMDDDDVLLICVKTQQTGAVINDILATGAAPVVVCLQNGVENERLALRVLPRVYGGAVVIPAAHLAPGEVSVYCGPEVGVIELGRAPGGRDSLCEEIAEDFRAGGILTEVTDSISASKYAKLLWNLGNAARAAFASMEVVASLRAAAQEEARACYEAAGIDCPETKETDPLAARGLKRREVAGRAHPGGSTWQSLSRGSGAETDYLNGEIVLLGRLHGVPTPVNETLARVIRQMSLLGAAPASFDPDEFQSMLDRANSAAAEPGRASA